MNARFAASRFRSARPARARFPLLRRRQSALLEPSGTLTRLGQINSEKFGVLPPGATHVLR